MRTDLRMLFCNFAKFVTDFSGSFGIFIFFLFLLSFFLGCEFVIGGSSGMFFTFLVCLDKIFLVFSIGNLERKLTVKFVLCDYGFVFSEGV